MLWSNERFDEKSGPYLSESRLQDLSEPIYGGPLTRCRRREHIPRPGKLAAGHQNFVCRVFGQGDLLTIPDLALPTLLHSRPFLIRFHIIGGKQKIILAASPCRLPVGHLKLVHPAEIDLRGKALPVGQGAGGVILAWKVPNHAATRSVNSITHGRISKRNCRQGKIQVVTGT